VDAGVVVDPFDDGGVFVAGDICSNAIPVAFDGGLVTTVSVDLAAATNQYKAICNSSNGTSNDLIFQVTLTQPKGLIVTATDTSSKPQDSVLSLISSPCPGLAQAACSDEQDDTAPEVLRVDRVPAGTWYVLLENWADDNLGDGTFDVQFELVDAAPGPANDFCSAAQALTFTNGAAMVTGTTTGAFNDTAGQPLTCSSASATHPDVFYSFVLTQPQDVTVVVDGPATSNLSPAIAITTSCGVGGMGVERGCDTGLGGRVTGRSLPAGTYYIVVDGDGVDTGDFTLDVTLTPPTPAPTNDTCATPVTLVPTVSQMVDANAAASNYTFSCGNPSGGDVVYQFTTTAPQKITVTATGTNGADGVLSLRAAPCDDSTNELGCKDDAISSPEVVTALNAPAGTYYVVLAAYSPSAGQFGVSLQLDAPVLPPSNDTCSAPATLVPNTSQSIDLAAAVADYLFSCSAVGGGDAVYQFTTTQAQRVVVTATGVGSADAVLALRAAPCDTSSDITCANNAGTLDPEVLTKNYLPPGTYYVLIGSDGVDTTFGLELSLEPPRPPPTNESCSAPDVVTLTAGAATRLVDLTDAAADITPDLCGTSAVGGDVVYQVVIPAGQTLTVVVTPTGTMLDSVVFDITPVCTMATSEVCADTGYQGDPETLVVPNTTGAPKTVFIVVKAYDSTYTGEANITFSAM
jgi:hypothetical protein